MHETGAHDFILDNAERLIKLTALCVISSRMAAGLDQILDATPRRDDWHQAVIGLRDDSVLMAVIRAYSLLDKEPNKVSFQAIYRSLETVAVQADLLNVLEERFGYDVFENRPGLIEEFLRTYREINWDVHGRLMHLRNLGIAHLTLSKVRKSLTFDELNTLIDILSRLAAMLQHLCQTQTAFRADDLDEYRELAKKAIRSAGR
jgi:hypothetical protein